MTIVTMADDPIPPPPAAATGPDEGCANPPLVVESLTTGVIPADTSGDDDDLYNTSSGMEDSNGEMVEMETTFEDSAGYFDEEVTETEYDEEEIVEEDEEMVEEVIESEHASEHDLVEVEVVEGTEHSAKLENISEEVVEEGTENSEKTAEGPTTLVGESPGQSTAASDLNQGSLSAPDPMLEVPVDLKNERSSSASQGTTGPRSAPSAEKDSGPSSQLQQSISSASGEFQPEDAVDQQTQLHQSSSALQQSGSSLRHELQGSALSLDNEPLNGSAKDVNQPAEVLPAASSESDAFFEADSPASKEDASEDEIMVHEAVADVVASPVVSPISHPRPSLESQGMVASSLMVGSTISLDDREDDAPEQPTRGSKPEHPVTGDVYRPPPPVIARSTWQEDEDPTDEGGGRMDEIATVASASPMVPTIPEGDELAASSNHPNAEQDPMADLSEASKHSSSSAPIVAKATEASECEGWNPDELWSAPVPAVEDEPAPVVSDPTEEFEREGSSSGYMWTVPPPAVEDELTAAESSEHLIAESGDSPYSHKEFVTMPDEQPQYHVDDRTKSIHASACGTRHIGAFTGAAVVDASEEEVEEEEGSARNDVEAAMEKSPDVMKRFDVDRETSTEEAPRRKLKMADIMLILCIFVVFLVLVITLPVVLTKQNTNRDLPTPSPITPAPSSPTPSPQEYMLVGGPFQGAKSSQLGAAVSLHGDVAVAGLPGTAPGTIFTFQPLSTGNTRGALRGLTVSKDNSWLQTTQLLQGQQSNDLFGSATSLYNNGMIVGAPGTLALGTNTPTGAAYFFEFSTESSSWSQLGTIIRGEEDIYAANEQFGAAVSTSGVYRVVVGAPARNEGDGGVYTFELDKGTMTWTRPAATGLIFSNSSRELLGSAISISFDGERMIAGAPAARGESGRVLAYQWNVGGSEWIQVADLPGNPGDGFGSSVACLSLRGDVFAAGAPSGSSGGGIIRVFKKMEGSMEFLQLGPEIIGEDGDGLGAPGSIAGSVSGDRMVLLAGTVTGRVRRFEYANDGWKESMNPIDTGLSQAITGLSSDDQSLRVIVGASSANTAAVYAVSSNSSPSSPESPAPALQPTATGTAVPSELSLPPAASPVPSPLPSLSWSLSSTFPTDSRTNLGVSVSLVSLLMAAGATTGAGFVNIYQRSGSEWVLQTPINGNEQGSRFGESVDFNPSEGGLVVGAPGTLAEGTSTAQGAAYYYSFTNSEWTERGGAIRGDNDVYAANEDFGYSVAASGTEILVIGAPKSSYGNVIERGRAYSFSFDSTSSSWLQRGSGTSAMGEAASDQFGAAVDISADGSTMVVGAPGQSSGAGAFYVYTWDGADWTQISKVSGEGSDALGESVMLLSSDDGSVVAAGGPGHNGGSGIIRVYQLQGGSYVPMGRSIIGEAGDRLGSHKSLSGSADAVIAGTAGGSVKTFIYDSGIWSQNAQVVSTGANAGVSLSGSTTLGSFVAGTSGDVQVYSMA